MQEFEVDLEKVNSVLVDTVSSVQTPSTFPGFSPNLSNLQDNSSIHSYIDEFTSDTEQFKSDSEEFAFSATDFTKKFDSATYNFKSGAGLYEPPDLFKSIEQQTREASLTFDQYAQDFGQSSDDANASYKKIEDDTSQFLMTMRQIGLSSNTNSLYNPRPFNLSSDPEATGYQDGGSQSIGSLFGAAHGLTAAGRITGIPALTEAGSFLYLEQGVQSLSKVFGIMNDSIL